LICTLPHGNDGVIFSKISPPYSPGRCDDLIKWKPPHMNSIDFLIVPNQKYDKLLSGKFKNQILDLYLFNYEKQDI
jgi:mRNA guanylyltransferase